MRPAPLRRRHWLAGTVLLAPLTAQVEHFDPAGKALVAADAVVETLAADRQFLEGPVWLPDEQALVCSDIPAGVLLRWTAAKGLVEWLPTEHSNGNTRDRAGRLLTCQHGARNLIRRGADGKVEVLAVRHQGQPLNSPNDVVVRHDGSIWFTDPTYGLGKTKPAQAGNFVYRLPPDGGEPVVVQREFAQPNGLCFRPDHQLLYVADSGAKQRIGAFPVLADGTLGPAERWLPQGSDGMRCDRLGNLWTTTGRTVVVWSPAGTRLAAIALAEAPTNCAFGGADGMELFVTARRALYRVRVLVAGAPLPPPPAPPARPAAPAADPGRR